MTLIVSLETILVLSVLWTVFSKTRPICISKKVEYLVSSVLFISGMFILMKALGVIDSGFHYIDDYEVYTFRDVTGQRNLFEWLVARMTGDLNLRFRPTYILFRVIFTYIAKDNFWLWHMTFTLIGGANCSLLYILAREFGFEIPISYVFAIITFIGGGQAEVLYRLGPQESVGLLFLLIMLLGLLGYVRAKRIIYLVVALVFELFMAYFKESFLLIVPIVPFVMAMVSLGRKDELISFRAVVIISGRRPRC